MFVLPTCLPSRVPALPHLLTCLCRKVVGGRHLACFTGTLITFEDRQMHFWHSTEVGQLVEDEALQKHKAALLKGHVTAPSLLSDARRFARWERLVTIHPFSHVCLL